MTVFVKKWTQIEQSCTKGFRGVLRRHLVIIRTRPDVQRAPSNDHSNHTLMVLAFLNFSTRPGAKNNSVCE